MGVGFGVDDGMKKGDLTGLAWHVALSGFLMDDKLLGSGLEGTAPLSAQSASTADVVQGKLVHVWGEYVCRFQRAAEFNEIIIG